MPIPEDIIDKVRERSDIVEVISHYVPLKKFGRNYKANCPFHNEKTPSFVVSPDKQIYRCFGCGAGGNVFSFLMKQENLQFPETVEMLAQKAGVVLPKGSYRKTEESSFAAELYKINEEASFFFQAGLKDNARAKEYIASRGIGEETIKKFRIGYAGDSWEAIINYFKKKGVSEDAISKAGLAIPSDRGGYYDRFRNRVIFPIIDLKDRTLGFGARVLDASLPKYINSPETTIYSKGRHLYGLNFSKEAIKKEGYALVVEGYLDLIIPYQAGVKNIIATLGTALTVDQIKLLKRFAGTVIMVYDPDEAGESASLRNLDLFISEGVNVYIAELSDGLDPDNYIRKFGTEGFLQTIKSSKNIFDYKLDKLIGRFDIKTSHGKTGIAGEMVPTISRIPNAVLKSALVKKLAERLGVDEESVKAELKKVKPEHYEKRYVVTPVEAKKDSASAEIMILALLLDGGDLVSKAKNELSPDELKSTSIREIVCLIFDMHKENIQINPSMLITRLGNSAGASSLISEAAGALETISDKTRAMSDCICRIKKDNVKDRLTRLHESIRSAHAKGEEKTVKSLMEEYGNLVKNKKV